MSRKTSQASRRTALQGMSAAAKSHALAVGRPVAIVAVTSGLALSAVGTAHAGAHTDQAAAPVAAPVVAPVTAPVDAPVAAPVVAPVAAPTAAASTHTVVPGDTLGGISAHYGADLNAVLAANGLSSASIIYPGDSIVLPAAGTVVAPVAVVAPVVVAPVETVAVVAPVETVVAPVETVVAPVQEVAVQQAASFAPAAVESGFHLTSANIAPVTPPPAPKSASVAASNVAGALVASAYGQVGITQDCTAMVENALRSAGIPVGDLGPSQFFQFGSTVGTPAPGDLVITGGHVAIYVGNGQVISGGMNGVNATMQHPLSDLPGASFVRVAG